MSDRRGSLRVARPDGPYGRKALAALGARLLAEARALGPTRAPRDRRQMGRPASSTPPPVAPRAVWEDSLRGMIGSDPSCNVSLRSVSAIVKQATEAGARALLLSVNSPGGDVSEAFKIQTLLTSDRRVTVMYIPPHCRADSAATIPILSADYVVVDPRAVGVLTHGVSGGTPVSNEYARRRIAEYYVQRSFLGELGTVDSLLASYGDRRFGPSEMLQYGLTDEIGDLARAREVATAFASAWPEWPSAARRERRIGLEVRESMRARR